MKFSLVLLSLLGSLALCHADAVRLQINGPDGKPVAGAQVRVLEMTMRTNGMTIKDLIGDADGKVALESLGTLVVEPQQGDTNQSAMAARIVAPGLAVAVFQLKAGDNTVSLATGRTLEGVALDKEDKPVANVGLLIGSLPFTPLTLRGVQPAGTAIRLPDELALRTTTDAQGKWKFESLPLTGKVDIEAQDTRFKREVLSVEVAQVNPSLHLSQGSAIKGRLLKPDGTGAAGVRIYAGNMDSQVVTDAEGRFEIMGVGNTFLRLQALPYMQNLPFIVPPKQVTGVKVGEVLDIGDWKTEAGNKLKGRVLSAATKKPIENASIATSNSSGTNNTLSDKNGNFELVIPNSASGLTVSANGFVNHWAEKLPPMRAGVIDVGTLELKDGQKLSGVIVDETDKPAGGLSLYVESAKGTRSYASTDENGGFSFAALEAGTYTIKSDGLEFTTDATFKAEPGKSPTARLIVKNSAGQGGNHEITGQVINSDGAPVEGAQLTLFIQRNGSSYSMQSVTSGTDGRFKSSISGLVSKVSVQSLTLSGFLRDQEKSEVKDGNWNLSLSLQKSGALKGRVVDVQGHAVKGAFVGTQKGDELPVVTDENGAFTLSGVPLKNVTLLASDGASLATFEVKQGGEPIEIALSEVAVEDQAALADRALAGAALWTDWEKDWDVVGQQRIEALLIRRKDAGNDWRWNSYLQELARRNPRDLVERETELRAQTSADTLPELERLIMLAKATSTDPAQREQVVAWLGAQQKEKRAISQATVTRLLGLAQVSSRLDAKDSAMWLDYAAQIAEQLGDSAIAENSWQWSALVARTSPQAVQFLSENWTPAAKQGLIGGAMQAWLEDNDIQSAKQGWADLQEIAVEIAKTPTPEGVEDRTYQLRRTRTRYIELLSRTEPKAALPLIEPLEEYEKPKVLIGIAREAARLGQFDVARQALDTLMALRNSDSESYSQGAAVAETFDATFAGPIWEKAYSQAKPSNDIGSGERWHPSLAGYAQERAAKWPGESRILIEREWAKRLIWNATPPKEEWDPNAYAMKSLAEAMAHLNPRRAVEMAEQVPERDNQRIQTRGQVAVALLRALRTPKP